MTNSPFYLEHYLDSLENLPGELRKNFTKMHDKDVMNKDIMVQIDGASDEYLRKVRDLSPTKRKAEMEKIQVSKDPDDETGIKYNKWKKHDIGSTCFFLPKTQSDVVISLILD